MKLLFYIALLFYLLLRTIVHLSSALQCKLVAHCTASQWRTILHSNTAYITMQYRLYYNAILPILQWRVVRQKTLPQPLPVREGSRQLGYFIDFLIYKTNHTSQFSSLSSTLFIIKVCFCHFICFICSRVDYQIVRVEADGCR